MNKVQKEQLIDEYDEATLKLFMEKYAESEDMLLWNKYKMSLQNKERNEMPTELDLRCKELIRAHMSNRNRGW